MSRAAPPRSDLALWLVLVAGFSPAIAEYARGIPEASPPSTLLAPVLIAICAWRGVASAEEPRRAGLALIGAGLLLELVGIALRTWTIEWLGFPVAVLGLALWLGRPSWRVALLAFGLIPVPTSLQIAFTPSAETALLDGACAAWRALGLVFSCTGPVARLGDRSLELQPYDVGWALLPALAQLGWFLAVSRGASVPRTLGTALTFAAAALVVQPLAIGLALALFAAISPDAAEAWLAHGVWLAAAVCVVLWSLRGAPASPGRSRPPG